MRVDLKVAKTLTSADGVRTLYAGNATFDVEEALAKEWCIAGDAVDPTGKYFPPCRAADAGKNLTCDLPSHHASAEHRDPIQGAWQEASK